MKLTFLGRYIGLLAACVVSVSVGAAAPGAAAPAASTPARLPKLTLSGPFAAVSFPLIHMVDSGALRDVADTVEFVPWKDPDQLRVLALDRKQPADFVAMPSNVAANLYNRGVPLKLINVSTWGVLWLVSRDPQLKTWPISGQGSVDAVPRRHAGYRVPDAGSKSGAGPEEFPPALRRHSTLDAMQLLIARRADHALLAEPAVSMALRKTKSFGQPDCARFVPQCRCAAGIGASFAA